MKLYRNLHFFMFTVMTVNMTENRTSPPLVPHHHFLFMWNAPFERCNKSFKVPLDLSHFQVVSSTLITATNQTIALFYTDRFGIFPEVIYDDDKMIHVINEGLPQLVDLEKHSNKAMVDIKKYIPDQRPGLAVLDFEEWRPQWIRNWGSKDIYRQISIETVKNNNPAFNEDEAEERAKAAFERGAKKFFLRSLGVGKRLRPGRQWGFYLFPDCYNYEYKHNMTTYNGTCPRLEEDRNDQLLWLWQDSTALYPSIYLDLVLQGTRQARLFVRHRIQEAIRVSRLGNSSYSTPIYAYIRPVYKDRVDTYMSEDDLVNTIGEAAALGAAGVISWGDMKVANTKDSCLEARLHLERTMNPYIVNVSAAVRLCSEALCQSKGRCVRKHWESDDYLHLDPHRYHIQRYRRTELVVKGSLSQDDVDWFEERFECVCYTDEPCYSVLTLNILPEFVQMESLSPALHSSFNLRPLTLLASVILCFILTGTII